MSNRELVDVIKGRSPTNTVSIDGTLIQSPQYAQFVPQTLNRPQQTNRDDVYDRCLQQKLQDEQKAQKHRAQIAQLRQENGQLQNSWQELRRWVETLQREKQMHAESHAVEVDQLIKERDRLKVRAERRKSGKTIIKDLQSKLIALRGELDSVNQQRMDEQHYFKEQIRQVDETAAKRVFQLEQKLKSTNKKLKRANQMTENLQMSIKKLQYENKHAVASSRISNKNNLDVRKNYDKEIQSRLSLARSASTGRLPPSSHNLSPARLRSQIHSPVQAEHLSNSIVNLEKQSAILRRQLNTTPDEGIRKRLSQTNRKLERVKDQQASLLMS